ncbi:MAG: hypothetical protein JWN30_899 [Bacilli bacterium]|nr:hypothetical protein [Bacilli bacterium]
MLQPTKKPKVLIFYANYGEGHKRAALALHQSLTEQMPDAEIISEDFLGDAFPFTDWVMRNLYLETYHRFKSIYGYIYYKTKDMPADAPVFQLLSYLGSWKLERYLRLLQPDIVISTFPSLTGMLSAVKERERVPFSLWCVLTDYVAHSQWLYKIVDHYFVPTEKIRQDLQKHGIDRKSITISGIPILPAFYENKDRNQLRKKYGLDEQKTTLVISAGAFGVTNVADVCKTLVTTCPSAQFVVVCGRNHKMYQQMLGIRNSGMSHLFPLPFVQEMDEIMQLADLFITKAGGLSVTEGLASQVPMVLFQSLPGQETENAAYLSRAGVAHRVNGESELIATVTRLVTNEAELLTMKKAIVAFKLVIPPALKIARLACDAFAGELSTPSLLTYKPQQLGARGEVY